MAHVTREQLEQYLDKVQERTKDPKAGLFGPDSMMWRVGREMIGGIGGGRALLLQTAHPYVAHAVVQHSKYRTDPHGRGARTFKAVDSMLFGTLDSAFRASRRVHTVHEMIEGQITERVGPYNEGAPYIANHDEALLWVHATLWDTSIQVYELIVGRLTPDEKERYYQESKFFAYLFGIPDSIIPPTWPEFMEYNRKMWDSDILTVGSASVEIAYHVLQPPKPEMQPVMDWFKIMTAGFMSPRIRHQYRFKYGLAEKAIFETSIRSLRAVYPRLHQRFRFSPAYLKALERIGQPKNGGLLDGYFKKIMQKQMNPTGYRFAEA